MNIVEKGDAARKLMDDPIFNEAVNAYKRYIFETWSDSATDEQTRECLWIEQLALEAVIVHLDSFVNDGVYEKQKKGWNNKS